ncbi:triose-phosphate isomerase [bacterium]|nr:triose-phosphate isomerase [bacterium]
MKKLHGKPIIAGNWKMHKTNSEALELVQEIRNAAGELKETELVVIPPFPALSEVKKILQNSPVEVGAQNMYWEEEGAYTGEVSPPMLKDAGCTYVVIGHSERREYFGETNQTVNKKIKAALDHSLTPIVCIGETKKEREEEKTNQKIKTQLSEGFTNMTQEEIQQVIIAYEPIWAIGTGLTATPDQAQEVHHFIREQSKEAYGKEIGDYAIILYGGSVKPKNAYPLVKEPDINGALIGGASLKCESFIQIAKESIKAYKDKK